MSAPDWDGQPPWVADSAANEPQQLSAFDELAGAPPVDPVERSTAGTVSIPQAPPSEGVAPRVDPGMPTAPIERVPSLPVDRTGNAERDAQLEAQRQQRMLEERERRAEEERRRRAEEERRERERRAEAAAVVPPFLTDRADAPPSPAAGQPPSPAAKPPPSTPPERTVPRAPQAPQAPQQRSIRRSSKEEWAAKREDLVPVWERQPIRAYPTMRRRIGIGGSGDAISTLTTLLAVLAVIALVIFAIIALPSLLGGSTPGRTTGPGAVVSPGTTGVAATTVPTPTAVPQPTPRTYTIQAGDSLFMVALEFGVTVDQLLAANPDIEDANYVTIGQVIVIPDAASPSPGSPGSPRATGSPPP